MPNMPRMQLTSKPTRPRWRKPMPTLVHRETFQVPKPLMHLLEKQSIRRGIRRRAIRFALAVKRNAKPFPVIPAPSVDNPSRELQELREYVQVLDEKLSEFVAYLADTEQTENRGKPFKPGEYAPRTVPAPVAEHCPYYLTELRGEAHTLHLELGEYVALLARTEASEHATERAAVIDLTVDEP